MALLLKYRIPLFITFFLVLGITSSAILWQKHVADNKPVNIFEKTKDECPFIRWTAAIDSSQVVYPIHIEGELQFAGERVPLEDPDVKERLERELQLNAYWHSNTMLNMRMANRYFDEIEKILIENDVPTDFKYLALVESGFRHDVSPTGASGYWQFMKPTAKSYGLEMNGEVDERYHLEKATAAACKYLKEANERLGNWTLAAASYNLGIPGMAERVKDQQSNHYYDMYFNQETSRYVFRMLAMKIIFSNPQRAGFYMKPEDLYQPYRYKVVEVDTPITNIAAFANGFGLKYKHIKILNPWLREAQLTNKDRKKYLIKLLETN